MRVRCREVLWTGLICLASVGAPRVRAQVDIAGSDAPGAGRYALIQDSVRAKEARASAPRKISLDLHGVSLKEALRAIAKKGRVVLFYNDREIPGERRVSVSVSDATVAEALRSVLRGTELRARRTAAGIVIERRDRSGGAQLREDSTGSVIGTVTDSTTGAAVVGASVTLAETRLRAVSGEDGRFRITGVQPGTYTVTARRLGYAQAGQRVTVAAGLEAVADFSLVQAPRMLDQIVTTATGDLARRQVGNAIAVLRVDSLVGNAPVTNLSQAIAGRIAGVQVFFPGGLTGASPQINIRGQNSLSLPTQPLLIVDGVRVANGVAGGPTAPAYAGATSGRFNDISLADIESIEIVKGPSAATLYGTDAANGVILISTKRGGAGRPTEWHVFADAGVLTYDRNRFTTSYVPWGHLNTGAGAPMRCPLLSVAAGTCVQDSITHFSPLLEPTTTPIGRGWRYAYGAQMSGGSTATYFLSTSVEDEVGYLRMPDADRALLSAQRGQRRLPSEELHPNAIRKLSARANFTVPVARIGQIAVSTSFLRQRDRIPGPAVLANGATSLGIRDASDGWRAGFRPGDSFVKRHRENVTHFTGGLAATCHASTWFTCRVTGGVDFSSTYLDQLARAGEGFTFATLNGARENTKRNTLLGTFDANATAVLPAGKLATLRTSVGVQYSRRTSLTNTAAARQLAPGTETVAGGAIPLVLESTVQSVVAGAYAEETIGLHERLFLTGAIRMDGGSAFGRGFKAAIYPKASVSWLVSDEPFWPSISWLTSLRLRAAYGHSGVQPGPIAALASEELFPVAIDGGTTTGAGLGAVGNRNLKPERQREIEGGVDMELLNGRLAIEATFYDKRSSDALVSVPLPASLGGGARWENVGSVRNRGYEAAIHARLVDSRIVQWDLNLNGSLNDNTVLSIAPGISAQYGAGGPGIVRGHPLFSYFEYPITDYNDQNGNGILEVGEVAVGERRTYAGRAYPRVQLGGTTSLNTWHDHVRVTATIDHRGGFSLYNGVEGLRCFFDACAAVSIPGAPLDRQAAALAFKSPQLHNTIVGFVEDASFTRLRELSLTYTPPSDVAQSFGARAVSITLSGRNLALWTRYSGPDPEVRTFFGSPRSGASSDSGAIPPARYWLVRINIAF